jgi:peptide deformylase
MTLPKLSCEFDSRYPLHEYMNLDNNILNQVCAPVDFSRSLANLRLAQRLIQTMVREHGIGLAANQVGINTRLFVMYVDGEFFHCFMPEIVSYSSELEVSNEGCLSYPGEQCQVARYASIRARFANASGHFQEREFSGLAARCFQHELDHLNGVTMYQRQADLSSVG